MTENMFQITKYTKYYRGPCDDDDNDDDDDDDDDDHNNNNNNLFDK